MDGLDPLPLGLISAAVMTVATIGGLGGAVLLVPVVVLAGAEPSVAVPLGLLSVAAGSLAAAAPQISSGLVNQRLGVVVEVAASSGAVGGAVVSGSLDPLQLRLVLAGVALLAAASNLARAQADEPAAGPADPSSLGELPGSLAGVVPTRTGTRRYEVRRLGPGLAAMVGVGFIAGVSGTSGGYLKTPLLNRVMGVPAKAAAATTTFTVGMTAASALGVIALQGRLEPTSAAAVVGGAIVGGRVGAAIQSSLPSRLVRVVLSIALLVIGAVLAAGP